ncbi:glucose/quinate/shikimate family membrane-bound PQQ-dependent dehydrogenase [Azospirillum thermophilum]|uniref:Membrane-bound PQQ-dependent dehydrogenase, glucose/quinate/shikimate family n=1 Tax=Azospirillum thermophilum TaxID=2202148 RepID=A0A2S2CLS2_9PROT|nr:glucose/quinate/shikimate family membrane-bound PQQ-dependent dehydrogenase [Azospirillum thermophilum]AWK85320.1 membrane-bound PQQ-dependent dehydrogenase, glucose/quinate/shikimate family [Azospirillum thermophilum]
MAITFILFLVIGLALGFGGGWLISLGGSWYYLLAGIAFLATSLLVLRRSPAARLLYALLIAGTLGWALSEVGLDWWQLGTRGGLVVLLGLWLLTPWATGRTPGWWIGRAALWIAVIAALAVAGASMLRDPHDLEGRLTAGAVTPDADTGGVPAGEWHDYGRSPYGQRYSPLAQITPQTVGKLQVAWTYRTGDMKRPEDVSETTYQVTPLKVGDLLYLCTPHHIAIALDAATGQERWRFDPKIPLDDNRQHQTCRGVSYHADPARSGQSCAARIFLPTADARLIALDALTGTPCPGFGREGTVDLWANMPNRKSGFYYSTSPPVVARGLVVIGGSVNDNYAMQEPSGVIRAYDAGSGALVWNWDSGNPDRTTPLGPDETYTANSPNSWSVMSADETLGLVYVPLGNRTPDQLGMGRSPEVERFSSSIVALDLATGQLRWVRQTVHHDLWDMDVPAQPVLLDLDTPGGRVPALVGPTKQGDIYVLDRRTGEPIFPIREVPAPGGTIPEDFSSPTQPVSGLTFMPEPLKESNMWGVTLFDQLACRIRFHSLRYEGRYTPPSLQGTLVYPGNFGVFNWGSVAVDPVRQVMFGMPTYLAFTSQLIPGDQVGPGQKVNTGEAGLNMNVGGPYAVRMQPFTSPLGLPCQAPPWGYVAGVDLRTGQIAWKHRNGTVQDAGPVPLPPIRLGVPGIGGPMITAGGVAFLGASIDNYLRAYDLTTGRQLWEHRLPAGGQATPMSYMADGRQFVVHVAGGHGSIGTTPGDHVIAYALPKQ